MRSMYGCRPVISGAVLSGFLAAALCACQSGDPRRPGGVADRNLATPFVLRGVAEDLRSGDSARRLKALGRPGLRKMDPSEALPLLAGASADPHAEVRRQAVVRLGASGLSAGVEAFETVVLPALEERLADPHPRVRRVAILEMGRLLSKAGGDLAASKATWSAVFAVADASKRGPVDERTAALNALGAVDGFADATVPALVAALGAPEVEVRWAAARNLGAIGPPAIAAALPLSSAAADTSSRVRSAAITALGEVGAPAEVALDPLVAGVGDNDLEVRGAAVVTLRRYGSDALPAVPALVRLMMDANQTEAEERVRRRRATYSDPDDPRPAAAETIGAVGAGARGAVPELVATLESSCYPCVVAAAGALRQIGLEADRAVPALIRVMQNRRLRERDGLNPRAAAAGALAAFPADARVVPAWETVLRDGDLALRTAAIDGLKTARN